MRSGQWTGTSFPSTDDDDDDDAHAPRGGCIETPSRVERRDALRRTVGVRLLLVIGRRWSKCFMRAGIRSFTWILTIV